VGGGGGGGGGGLGVLWVLGGKKKGHHLGNHLLRKVKARPPPLFQRHTRGGEEEGKKGP